MGFLLACSINSRRIIWVYAKILEIIFLELMQNFELGPDEACIVADDDRNIKIIGATDKKNHENILADR